MSSSLAWIAETTDILPQQLLQPRRDGAVVEQDPQLPGHLFAVLDAPKRVALVGDDDGVDLALSAEDLLDLGEGHHHGRAASRQAALLDDPLDGDRQRLAFDVDVQRVAGLGFELFGGALVDVRLAASKRRQRGLTAGYRLQGPEPLQ